MCKCQHEFELHTSHIRKNSCIPTFWFALGNLGFSKPHCFTVVRLRRIWHPLWSAEDWMTRRHGGWWSMVHLPETYIWGEEAEYPSKLLVISLCVWWGLLQSAIGWSLWSAAAVLRGDPETHPEGTETFFFWSACQTCFTCLSVVTCEIRDLKLTAPWGFSRCRWQCDLESDWSCWALFLMSGGLFAVILFFPGLTFFLFGMEGPDIMTCGWFGLLRPWDHHCGRVTTARHIEGMLHLPHWDVSGGGMVGLWSH